MMMTFFSPSIRMLFLFWHKSTLAVPKNFPKILITFKIKNLATSNCVNDLGKVAPGKVRAGDSKLVR